MWSWGWNQYGQLGYGPFGFGNLGDAAIQEAMLQHVREYLPTAQIYGFSLNPEDTEKRRSKHSTKRVYEVDKCVTLLGAQEQQHHAKR